MPRMRSSSVSPGNTGRRHFIVGLNEPSIWVKCWIRDTWPMPSRQSKKSLIPIGANVCSGSCNRLAWYGSLKFSIMTFQFHGRSGRVLPASVVGVVELEVLERRVELGQAAARAAAAPGRTR